MRLNVSSANAGAVYVASSAAVPVSSTPRRESWGTGTIAELGEAPIADPRAGSWSAGAASNAMVSIAETRRVECGSRQGFPSRRARSERCALSQNLLQIFCFRGGRTYQPIERASFNLTTLNAWNTSASAESPPQGRVWGCAGGASRGGTVEPHSCTGGVKTKGFFYTCT